MNEEKMSMTEGPVWKNLVRFAIPLLLGNLFQQLYNAVDSLVVGNFCGNEALAAVSSSGSMQHLLIGFFQGVFIGASVIISRAFGAKDKEGMDEAIHTTVVFALVMGVILTVLGVAFTPTRTRLKRLSSSSSSSSCHVYLFHRKFTIIFRYLCPT